MQKWEYMFVVSEWIAAFKKSRLRVRIVNGQQLPNWENGPSFFEFVNKLGEEGWEMVSAEGLQVTAEVPGTATSQPRMVFKRPKL